MGDDKSFAMTIDKGNQADQMNIKGAARAMKRRPSRWWSLHRQIPLRQVGQGRGHREGPERRAHQGQHCGAHLRRGRRDGQPPGARRGPHPLPPQHLL